MSDVIQQVRMNNNPDHKGSAHWDQASQTIEMGCDSIVLDKMFGPLIFSALRVRADYDRKAWVIERQWVKTNEWVEWVTIPCQIDAEFSDPPESPQ